MRMFRKTVILFTMVLSVCRIAQGQDAKAPPKPQPKTTADAAIPVDMLQIMLAPMTKDELVVEADGWLGLLKGKVSEISESELAVKWKNLEISKPASETAAPADRAPDEKTKAAEAKTALLQDINKLREQRTALIDRTNVVLKELVTKGGDSKAYDTYITAVSGIKIDVKDASAAWSLVRGWITSPQGGIRWGVNIVLFVVTLLVFKVVSSLVGAAVRRAVRVSKGVSNLLLDFLVNSCRKAVFLVGLVVALSMLEVDIGPFVAAIGAVGFVVGFALQGTLSNFAAGIMILLYRPYDLGDTVTVAGVNGKVESMSLVSTTIKSATETVVVPNNSIWGGAIKQHHG